MEISEHNSEQDSEELLESHSFETVATTLGIPKENWEHPQVKELVSFVSKVKKLQEELSIASSKNDPFLGHMSAEQRRHHDEDTEGLEPSLSSRYTRAELMLRVMTEVLEDGFNGRPAGTDYMRSKLDAAVGGYGLQVKDDPNPMPSIVRRYRNRRTS